MNTHNKNTPTTATATSGNGNEGRRATQAPPQYITMQQGQHYQFSQNYHHHQQQQKPLQQHPSSSTATATATFHTDGNVRSEHEANENGSGRRLGGLGRAVSVPNPASSATNGTTTIRKPSLASPLPPTPLVPNVGPSTSRSPPHQHPSHPHAMPPPMSFIGQNSNQPQDQRQPYHGHTRRLSLSSPPPYPYFNNSSYANTTSISQSTTNNANLHTQYASYAHNAIPLIPIARPTSSSGRNGNLSSISVPMPESPGTRDMMRRMLGASGHVPGGGSARVDKGGRGAGEGGYAGVGVPTRSSMSASRPTKTTSGSESESGWPGSSAGGYGHERRKTISAGARVSGSGSSRDVDRRKMERERALGVGVDFDFGALSSSSSVNVALHPVPVLSPGQSPTQPHAHAQIQAQTPRQILGRSKSFTTGGLERKLSKAKKDRMEKEREKNATGGKEKKKPNVLVRRKPSTTATTNTTYNNSGGVLKGHSRPGSPSDTPAMFASPTPTNGNFSTRNPGMGSALSSPAFSTSYYEGYEGNNGVDMDIIPSLPPQPMFPPLTLSPTSQNSTSSSSSNPGFSFSSFGNMVHDNTNIGSEFGNLNAVTNKNSGEHIPAVPTSPTFSSDRPPTGTPPGTTFTSVTGPPSLPEGKGGSKPGPMGNITRNNGAISGERSERSQGGIASDSDTHGRIGLAHPQRVGEVATAVGASSPFTSVFSGPGSARLDSFEETRDIARASGSRTQTLSSPHSDAADTVDVHGQHPQKGATSSSREAQKQYGYGFEKAQVMMMMEGEEEVIVREGRRIETGTRRAGYGFGDDADADTDEAAEAVDAIRSTMPKANVNANIAGGFDVNHLHHHDQGGLVSSPAVVGSSQWDSSSNNIKVNINPTANLDFSGSLHHILNHGYHFQQTQAWDSAASASLPQHHQQQTQQLQEHLNRDQLRSAAAASLDTSSSGTGMDKAIGASAASKTTTVQRLTHANTNMHRSASASATTPTLHMNTTSTTTSPSTANAAHHDITRNASNPHRKHDPHLHPHSNSDYTRSTSDSVPIPPRRGAQLAHGQDQYPHPYSIAAPATTTTASSSSSSFSSMSVQGPATPSRMGMVASAGKSGRSKSMERPTVPPGSASASPSSSGTGKEKEKRSTSKRFTSLMTSLSLPKMSSLASSSHSSSHPHPHPSRSASASAAVAATSSTSTSASASPSASVSSSSRRYPPGRSQTTPTRTLPVHLPSGVAHQAIPSSRVRGTSPAVANRARTSQTQTQEKTPASSLIEAYKRQERAREALERIARGEEEEEEETGADDGEGSGSSHLSSTRQHQTSSHPGMMSVDSYYGVSASGVDAVKRGYVGTMDGGEEVNEVERHLRMQLDKRGVGFVGDIGMFGFYFYLISCSRLSFVSVALPGILFVSLFFTFFIYFFCLFHPFLCALSLWFQ